MGWLFYEYAKCSTCVKARKWLESKKVSFKTIPIVEAPPSRADLEKFWKASGLELKKFFNTSGLVYKELDLSTKLLTMSEREMLDLLASNGKLIKRPLFVETGAKHRVAVGFKEEIYKTLVD